jgi:hypothetical protein
MGFRNRIINGDMRIDQRNNGASVSNIDGYGVDRWNGSWTGSSVGRFSAQRSTVAPTGFTNSWLLTVTTPNASPAATDGNLIRQAIEGFNTADLAWGSASAQPATLSFWVRCSVTGTFPLIFSNEDTSRNYGATYTVSAANTWEYKTITLPGDTTGTWRTDNTAGIRLAFGFGGGSSRTTSLGWQSGSITQTNVTGCTNLMATNGATFFITGVQLEAGSVATPFERRPYGTELALCQRYYEIARGGQSIAGQAGALSTNVSCAVEKRATPTVALVSNLYTQNTSTSNPAHASITVRGSRFVFTASTVNFAEYHAEFSYSAEL